MIKISTQNIIHFQTALSLLNTLQTLEQYQELCYNLYLLTTYNYEEQIKGQEETQICYITLGGKTRSYEPFGKIRAMDYGLAGNNAIIPTNTVTESTRAFTGHEQIKEISGLIHMNAT